ncbi:hypothetical protein KSD_01740 [Ktedonobacter sp. SOSP1-85]|uniref:hypothetical protein n=1 Tax=Ktedonobacter sp. SOSP1-85 TaxID=2778367 RepID=UPI001916777B|nr:hypothetical protein [Ktedonobacter sp. SOSP1-85]GHO72403.1 hypothetical protein KSD_01740 [Ktedonobacter sp. SOSP1-85]
MKYEYHFESTPNGSLVMQLPAEISLVTTFLFSDVQWSNGEHYLSRIDPVLEGKIPEWTETGNVCELEIRPDFTTILDILAEDDDPESECVIETSELRELIVIWMDATKPLVTPQNS